MIDGKDHMVMQAVREDGIGDGGDYTGWADDLKEVPTHRRQKKAVRAAPFKATLGIKLWKWVSLNYALAVLRIPLIQEDWQVTNTLLLTVKANLVK